MIDSHLGFEVENTITLFETILRISGPNGTITIDNNGDYGEWSEKITHNQPTAKWALFYDDAHGRHIFLHENMEEYKTNAIITELTRRLGEPIRC